MIRKVCFFRTEKKAFYANWIGFTNLKSVFCNPVLPYPIPSYQIPSLPHPTRILNTILHFYKILLPGLGKYWKLNRSSRWRHYLTNFHRKKNWYLSRKLMTIKEVLWINPDFHTMVVRYCVWWPEFLVSNILRCSATHVKANTRLERVRR